MEWLNIYPARVRIRSFHIESKSELVALVVCIVLYFALNVNYEHETILSLFILLRQFSPYLNHHFLFFAGISCRSG